ncbi:MAG: hypothetical protein PHD53_00870 [Methylococcales bacterium]|nr:hypothetical protein [Methylococcales bacterium]
MSEPNTYRRLIEVLQYVIQAEHTHFTETFCRDDSAEAMEDAFTDDEIQNIYKSAKLAYWDLLDNAKRYGLVDLNEEKKLEASVINAEIFLCEKKLKLLQHKRETL